eukprot:m.65125 g.65125  ORF g.65125 m.65125 type:complete len:369 (+) comp12583_c0_seq2:204-1310(+)
MSVRNKEALHEAVRRGWLDTCMLLLEDARSSESAHDEDGQGALAALVNGTNEIGRTPLHTALIHEHIPIVRLLLDSGADVQRADHAGCTPLHFAAASGLVSMVDLLLSHGANPNTATTAGHVPLHAAIQSGRESVVARLLTAGAVRSLVWKGLTFRAYCAHNGRDDLAALFPPADETTELATAVRSGSEYLAVEAARRHAAAAARARATPGQQPPSPVDPALVHVAVLHNSECVVRALLQLGVLSTAADSAGTTPLTNAIFWRSDAATRLLEHGVQPFSPRHAFLFGPDGRRVLATTILCAQQRVREGTLPALPDEMWLYIFSFLRPVDVQPLGAPVVRGPPLPPSPAAASSSPASSTPLHPTQISEV